MTDKLKFGTGNSKINELAHYLNVPMTHVVTFDLPAGHTCPFADKCKSQANRITGKITDGKDVVYRCYASSTESAFTNARKAHWHNFDLLQGLSVNAMVELIIASIPNRVKVVRLHSSGDFYNKTYFNAWLKVAELKPEIQFFGYTKGIQYVKQIKPSNFSLVYSYGGKLDLLVDDTVPVAYVVNDTIQADKMGLIPVCEINPSGDYEAIKNGLSFALIIHGTQPAKA